MPVWHIITFNSICLHAKKKEECEDIRFGSRFLFIYERQNLPVKIFLSFRLSSTWKAFILLARFGSIIPNGADSSATVCDPNERE